MKYRRTMKGFYVVINDHKKDTNGDMAWAEIHVFMEDGDIRICSAELSSGYQVQSISWSGDDEAQKLQIAGVGLSHHNSHALNNQNLPRYFPAALESDPELLEAMLEHGIAVLAEDRVRDDYYRANARELVFARTSKDRVASVRGAYEHGKRLYWREYINARLPDDEDVLEIINDRYPS